MNPLDRRGFLKVAGAGLSALSTAKASSPPDDEDPLAVRGQFPITESQAYLNTAYSSPTPRVVRDAAYEFADQKMLKPTRGRKQETKELARTRFADLFGARREEVAFLFSTSDGENIVANSLDLQPGDNIVVDELHFTTAFVLYRQLESEKGIELRVLPQKQGRVSIEDFEARVDRRTRLVSVAWVSNVNGYRHDLGALAEMCHAKGALLYADAIQALGTFPVNLRQEGVDFAAGNAYKWLFGSWGVAPFFIREEHLSRTRPDRRGHGQVAESLTDFRFRLHETARKFEYSNLAFGPIHELAVALEFIKKVGLKSIERHGVALAHELRDGAARLGFEILTPSDNPSPIVSLVHGRDPKLLARRLEEEGIVVSLRARGTQLRASVSMFNNRSDVSRLLDVLGE